MLTRKEAFKMAMDIDGHMNDNSQGIDLSWDSIEKLVNEAYAKGAAAAEHESCAKLFDEMADEAESEHEPSSVVNYYRAKAAAIRAKGQG